MLDAKDLEAIGNLLDEKLEVKLEEKLEEKLDKRFSEFRVEFKAELCEEMDKSIEKRVIKTESLLLDEIDRMKGHLDAKIDRLDGKVEEMRQYYRIDRIENQNITVIMRNIEALRKDVDELKEKQSAVGA